MNTQICQSCAMPLNKSTSGTNADNTLNNDYCSFCYDRGSFREPELTLDAQIKKLSKMAVLKMNISEKEARKIASATLPLLKRWQETE